MEGFEPSTPALRKLCSTVELHRQGSGILYASAAVLASGAASIAARPARPNKNPVPLGEETRDR